MDCFLIIDHMAHVHPQVLGFLSAFLETQMFTSFIDSKILSTQQKIAENVRMFDKKIAELRTSEVGEDVQHGRQKEMQNAEQSLNNFG